MNAVERNVESVYELSPLQEGLLVESLAKPEAGLYVEQVVLDLAGTLSPRAMARAWRTVVERHPILRTSFHWEGLERPVQVVHRDVRVPIAHNDLRRVPRERREAALRWFLEQDRARGFRFDRTPLLRVTMLQEGAGSHRVVVTLHHILLDGWSVGIVMDEVALIYRSLVDGIPWHLEPARPYEDYLAWLREQDSAAAERYWRAAFDGLEGVPALARLGGNVDGAARRFEFAEHERTLPRELADRVRETARERRVTLNTTVLGAWAILLGAELGTDDLVVGAVVSGRDVPLDRVDTIVGLCINTVPIRVRIRRDRPVGSWLEDLQAQQLELREFQHCALTDIHGWSGIPRRRALFESIFIFENHATLQQRSTAERAVGGRAFERTSYPLTVLVGVVPELSLKILYDTSVIDAGTVERLAEHLTRLLGQIAGAPETPIAELRWTTDAERRRALELGEGPSAPIPGQPVHELFAQRAELGPDALAVVDGERRLTFREVHRSSDELARRIRRLGGESEVVGVFLDRCADLPAAVLGVLKAGAVYLPLEPSQPSERLRFVLADSGTRIVVSSGSLPGRLPPFAGDVILLDAPAEAEATPLPRVSVEAPAWLLYTSGSSGWPKGVLGSHRGLVNRLGWGLREEPFEPGEVCCLKTRLSFVDSLWELLGPMVGGACVLVAPEEAVRDARVLAQLLLRERVTRLVAVPSLLASLVELAPGELAASGLRRITSSGEPLSGELAARLSALLPECRLLNLYGSTEVTADATCYPLPAQPAPGRVPIGRPLANVRVRVLGPSGELLPVGAVGELHVGGAGLALGYHGRAAADSEQRFMPDRFNPGQRLYRTGDLARWRPDGQLDYLGRADRQLKIRGVRVEPGELEHALQSHEAVREAAVVARPGPDGPELIAYVELAQPDTPADTLRAHLRTHLPDQLLPTHLLPLPQLPRLPSGKIDHTTLAERTDTTAREEAYEPPTTPVERAVADVYADLTRTEQVGRHDDFFALGGHSLLATRAAARLSDRFGKNIPLRLLFEHGTVAALAEALEALAAVPGDEPVPIVQLDRERFRTTLADGQGQGGS